MEVKVQAVTHTSMLKEDIASYYTQNNKDIRACTWTDACRTLTAIYVPMYKHIDLVIHYLLVTMLKYTLWLITMYNRHRITH